MSLALIQQLREKRAAAIADARAISDRFGADEITGDERSRYEGLLADAARMKSRIDQEETLLEEERSNADAVYAQRQTGAGLEGGRERRDEDPFAEQRAKRDREFREFMNRDGSGKFNFRALQADSDTAGGVLTGPETFVNRLIQAIDNNVVIRRRATVMMAPNGSLGVPSLDADPDDGDWTVELGTGSEDSTMSFGKREFSTKPVAKRIKTSKTLLRKAVVPGGVDGLVIQRFAYKFAVTQEKGFLTGTGVNQPLGLFTASNDGISTSRDVSTGNLTTAIKFDGLMEAKYGVKSGYRRNAAWLLHRDAVKNIAKEKDGDGLYIWQPSTQVGQPDQLLGHPVLESEYVPNTFTTGQYVGLFGDFSYYWIADGMELELQRLEELYAETNQVGFIARAECDGMPVLGEAFARIKLA